MLYLKNRNRYRHVLGIKTSTIPKFIFNINTFMGLKINAFRVIKGKPCFWADILDFGGSGKIIQGGIHPRITSMGSL